MALLWIGYVTIFFLHSLSVVYEVWQRMDDYERMRGRK